MYRKIKKQLSYIISIKILLILPYYKTMFCPLRRFSYSLILISIEINLINCLYLKSRSFITQSYITLTYFTIWKKAQTKKRKVENFYSRIKYYEVHFVHV